MSTYQKIVIGLITAAYCISPIDLIPDMFVPFIGWLDDIFIVGLVLYYFKNGIFRKTPHSTANHSTVNQKAKEIRSPYEVLEIHSGASKDEIVAAYRKAVKKYHPDKVAHLGKDLQELANQKFIEIREAYNQLIGSR